MTKPSGDGPSTEQEILDLTRETVEQLNRMADKLESFIETRNPRARSRRDDEDDPSQGGVSLWG